MCWTMNKAIGTAATYEAGGKKSGLSSHCSVEHGDIRPRAVRLNLITVSLLTPVLMFVFVFAACLLATVLLGTLQAGCGD